MAAACDEEAVRERLLLIDCSQSKINDTSDWLIAHPEMAEMIVRTWKSIFDTDRNVRTALLYVCNDMLQKRRKLPKCPFLRHWKTVLPGCMARHNQSQRGKKPVTKLIKVWEERRVFESEFIDKIKNSFSGKKRKRGVRESDVGIAHNKPISAALMSHPIVKALVELEKGHAKTNQLAFQAADIYPKITEDPVKAVQNASSLMGTLEAYECRLKQQMNHRCHFKTILKTCMEDQDNNIRQIQDDLKQNSKMMAKMNSSHSPDSKSIVIHEYPPTSTRSPSPTPTDITPTDITPTDITPTDIQVPISIPSQAHQETSPPPPPPPPPPLHQRPNLPPPPALRPEKPPTPPLAPDQYSPTLVSTPTNMSDPNRPPNQNNSPNWPKYQRFPPASTPPVRLHNQLALHSPFVQSGPGSVPASRQGSRQGSRQSGSGRLGSRRSKRSGQGARSRLGITGRMGMGTQSSQEMHPRQGIQLHPHGSGMQPQSMQPPNMQPPQGMQGPHGLRPPRGMQPQLMRPQGMQPLGPGPGGMLMSGMPGMSMPLAGLRGASARPFAHRGPQQHNRRKRTRKWPKIIQGNGRY
ncbi:hypothetical protein AAMO2058_001693200 [Amorphochlora amoebiformis]